MGTSGRLIYAVQTYSTFNRILSLIISCHEYKCVIILLSLKIQLAYYRLTATQGYRARQLHVNGVCIRAHEFVCVLVLFVCIFLHVCVCMSYNVIVHVQNLQICLT